LIDESADESLFKGELSTFITWCQAVPENLLKNYAHLYVRYARVLLYTGQIDKAELALTYLEKSVGSVSDLQGEVATLQADIARRREDTPKATELA
jgi:ATP/maltotriose-dependent transcriptional regulator MalT